MSWPCYWLASSQRVALGLRRFSWPTDRLTPGCEGGYHEAMAWRGLTAPERFTTEGGHTSHAAAASVSHGDPHWPETCDRGCGYRFAEADQWQPWEEPVFWRWPGGGSYVLRTGGMAPPGCTIAGPGAMWDGWWLPDGWKGPDGIGLIVRCPDPARPDLPIPHDWLVDSPATGGGRWTRTGTPADPRTLTVSPSIAIGEPGAPAYYHGFLQAGALTDHLGG